MGHDFALKYFQSSDYRDRKRELENRSLIELDVQKSRHYKPGVDFSNPSTPVSKPLHEVMEDTKNVD
jgi:hypothetical protein